MAFVKMCGMMRADDLQLCARLGVDAAGLVVEYPQPVPWNLTREEARRLVAGAPSGLRLVMVCSGTPDRIAALADFVKPHAVQIHGDEPLAEVEETVARLRPLGIGVFRALRIVPETGQAAGEIADPVLATVRLAQTGIEAIVVDSKVPHRPGGTGVPVDVAVVRRVVAAAGVPVIAAGGLRPENVAAVLAETGAWGADVLTGVEVRPGWKDPVLMERFVAAVRGVSYAPRSGRPDGRITAR